jgi:hypothetical protein
MRSVCMVAGVEVAHIWPLPSHTGRQQATFLCAVPADNQRNHKCRNEMVLKSIKVLTLRSNKKISITLQETSISSM